MIEDKIGLIIADDHPIVLEGLKRIVAECADMVLIDEANDGDQALEKCKNAQVDVLLLDINMPGPGFLEVIRKLEGLRPELRILVLSVHQEEHYVLRALKAGASGYLTKDHSPNQLANAIRQVHMGEKYVSPQIAEKLVFELLERDHDKLLHEELSDREYQVLCLLGTGKSVKEIAEELNLSHKTIGTYRRRILEKMNFRTTSELIRYTLKHGLIE